MKKLLAIVLMAVLLTTSVFAAAYESDVAANYGRIGAVLKELGLITGDGTGLNEGGTLLREQVVVITLRLNGLEAAAKSHVPVGMFTDVPKNHWAAPYIEYASKVGLTTGIGGGRFGLGMTVTAKQMATLMLRALGHTADWGTEDIMAKAKRIGITNDTGDGSGAILRGQTFIYIVNTLLVPKNGESVPYYKALGLNSEYLAKASAEISGGSNTTTNKPVEINLSKYLRPIKAKTLAPHFDELNIEFNSVIAQPQKSNFEFVLEDGRVIDQSKWTMAPGGSSVTFKFNDQNLHGKIVQCKIKDLKSATGFPMLSDASVYVQFKDFVNIQFVSVNVIDQKTFESTLSIDVMPISSVPHGYKVFSDGVELVENKDYKMGWGGRNFKVVFQNPDIYPKNEAVLTIWGYVTAPYHKYMEGELSVSADFTAFKKTEIPYEEPPAPLDPTIAFEQPDISLISEAWDDYVNTTANISDTTEYMPSTTEASSYTSYYDASSYNWNEPAYIYWDTNENGMLKFYTTKYISEIKGLVFVDAKGNTHQVKDLEYNSANENSGFVFRVDRGVEVIGGYIKVDAMIDAEHGIDTGSFIYWISNIIN